MSICGWLILGGLAGWIASLLTGRNERMGCIANIIVGIIGAMIGGWIVAFFGGSGVNGFNFGSLLVSILGAVVLLGIVNILFGRR